MMKVLKKNKKNKLAKNQAIMEDFLPSSQQQQGIPATSSFDQSSFHKNAPVRPYRGTCTPQGSAAMTDLMDDTYSFTGSAAAVSI